MSRVAKIIDRGNFIRDALVTSDDCLYTIRSGEDGGDCIIKWEGKRPSPFSETYPNLSKMCLSLNEQTLYCSANKEIYSCDLMNGECKPIWPMKEDVFDLQISGNVLYIVGSINIYALDLKLERQLFELKDVTTYLQSPCGPGSVQISQLVVSDLTCSMYIADTNGSVSVWCALTGKYKYALSSSKSPVLIALEEENLYVYSEQSIYIWNIRTVKCDILVTGKSLTIGQGKMCARAGRLYILDKNCLYIWDVSKKTCLLKKTIGPECANGVYHLCVTNSFVYVVITDIIVILACKLEIE